MKKKNKYRCGLFKLLKFTFWDTMIITNWQCNIFFTFLLFVPKLLSYFQIYNLNSDIKNIYLGSVIAILASININEGYNLFKTEKEWVKYYRDLFIALYINILYQVNELFNIIAEYYIPTEINTIENIYSDFIKIYKEMDESKYNKGYKFLLNKISEYKKIIEENYNAQHKSNLTPFIISTDKGGNILHSVNSTQNSLKIILDFISDNKNAVKEKLIITELSTLISYFERTNSENFILISTSNLVRLIDKLNSIELH